MALTRLAASDRPSEPRCGRAKRVFPADLMRNFTLERLNLGSQLRRAALRAQPQRIDDAVDEGTAKPDPRAKRTNHWLNRLSLWRLSRNDGLLGSNALVSVAGYPETGIWRVENVVLPPLASVYRQLAAVSYVA